VTAPANTKIEATPRRPSERRERMSFNESRELESLPATIEALEKELGNVVSRLGDPALYANAPQDVKPLTDRQAALNSEIEAAMARWEVLETKKASLQ
jgi:ATP-binding cassette subfamily F protein uup